MMDIDNSNSRSSRKINSNKLMLNMLNLERILSKEKKPEEQLRGKIHSNRFLKKKCQI